MRPQRYAKIRLIICYNLFGDVTFKRQNFICGCFVNKTI